MLALKKGKEISSKVFNNKNNDKHNKNNKTKTETIITKKQL